jgi:predicted TIM-barrel fold metal-dependent hydrolase
MKIFDSLSHPTLSSNWINKGLDASFESLEESLKANNYAGACAVGLPNDESYSHINFYNECKKYPNLYPVAAIKNLDCVAGELDEIVRIGYRAIKVHPRYLKATNKFELLKNCFLEAYTRNLIVFYCSYFHCGIDSYPNIDPLIGLVNLLKFTPKLQLIIVHGGDVRVMEYMELVRHNPNLLLDLSLTILKYEGSSIDSDLKFLFSKFDQRICIGTDHPEYTHSHLAYRFGRLSQDIDSDKAANISYKNIMKFLGIF